MKINIQLFAGAATFVQIYSNDGNTLIYENQSSFKTNDIVDITSTGIVIEGNLGDETVYTYSGSGRFLGVTDTANSSTVIAGPGDSFQIEDSSAYQFMQLILYIVEQVPETYKKILKDSHKVQVESAIRDGEGVKISTNYAKKSELVGIATTSTAGKVKPDGTTITITNDGTITAVGGGGGTQVQANWNESDNTSPAYIQNKPTIPSTASDVGALSNSTKYGASLSINGTSLQLKDQDGNNLGSAVTTQDTDTGATSVELKTGDTGNVVTAMTYDSGTRKITYEMGITALTSHQDIKTINNTSVVGSGNLDVKELFVCTYGTTTYSEITSALGDGKVPVCFYDNKQYVYVGLSSTNRYTFSSQLFDTQRYISVNSSDSWGTGNNNFEVTSNKVTSISSNSTDAQYPSAKCVYDLVGDIDTILTQLNSGQGV